MIVNYLAMFTLPPTCAYLDSLGK